MTASGLATVARIGTLTLPNRLVRSATAERLAGDSGRPRPPLAEMYRALARGGAGLIITGHMYVHPAGKAHPEMTGAYADDLIPDLAALADAVHQEGGRIAAQINHGGMQCDPAVTNAPVAPSATSADFLRQPARAMTTDEIEEAVAAYGQAARRVRQAGFDGVQLHGAHGYLISQFLSPYINRRDDAWGGDLAGRLRFLREVAGAVRAAVGADFPVLIKLGLADGVPGGLTLEESREIVAALCGLGLDAVETSGGVKSASMPRHAPEGFFREDARAVRSATRLPLILVGGLRTRRVMEEVLASGEADFISLCRPLICEPDLPGKLLRGEQDHSRCVSDNRCWPARKGDGISCKLGLRI